MDLSGDFSAIQLVSGEPRKQCLAWRARLVSGRDSLLCVQFDLTAPWLEGDPEVSLTALYLWRDSALEVAVLAGRPLPTVSQAGAQFDSWVAEQGAFVAREGDPLPLLTLDVDKPWGREIWFNGVEQRGVCDFGAGPDSTPQPWLLAVLPGVTSSADRPAVPLLKILEPSPEPVLGDLYFELHDVKQEVYVVTEIDRRAWPTGTGYLRFGFCPRLLAASGSEAEFRQAYLQAVSAYRRVREQLDGLPAGDTVDPVLAAREVSLRSKMNEFTCLKPVQVGDVIRVPRRLPHALQHGVSVVEFQTPVYERKILSFAQQVPNQAQWDTREAVEDMRLLPPPDKPAECLLDKDGVKVERVAETPEFEIQRLHLFPGAKLPLALPDAATIAVVLQGQAGLAGRVFEPRQAAWIPPGWRGQLVASKAAKSLVLLLALARR